MKSVIAWPFIGAYYWPSETKNVRFTLPYRILKVYFLIAYYLLKHAIARTSMFLTNYEEQTCSRN